MTARYFAYGSNLKSARMLGRVPGAAVEGVARLDDFRLRWDKDGADGSGKANLERRVGSRVWGVVYVFEAHRWGELDVHEGGYERVEVRPFRGEVQLVASTYVSSRVTLEPPFDWYKRLVVDGAREHGLPPDWLRWLEACVAKPG